MSEKFKKPRSVAEIQNQYSGLCARAGDLQYRIYTLTRDLAIINDTLKDLNAEAVASKNAEAEAAKQAEAQPKQEEVKNESQG